MKKLKYHFKLSCQAGDIVAGRPIVVTITPCKKVLATDVLGLFKYKMIFHKTREQMVVCLCKKEGTLYLFTLISLIIPFTELQNKRYKSKNKLLYLINHP